MTNTIPIVTLTTQNDYVVMATLRPGRVIISYQGTFVFADLACVEESPGHYVQRWELWAGSPSDADKAALQEVIENHGGFDHTTLTILPQDHT